MIPGPTNVSERVMRAMTKPIINHRSPEFHALYKSIIENAKYVFQTEGDVFILTCSGTGVVECALANVIQPGDKVIVPNFGFFCTMIKEAVKAYGGIPIEIPVEWGRAVLPDQVKEAFEAEKDVKMICIVYNETSTGVKVADLKEIGKIASEYGALLMVDAISILGGDECPVDEWNMDLCVVGSQKCLAAPPGLALISVSEKAWEVIEENLNRPTYFDLVRHKDHLEKYSETPFTPSVPLFYALDEALEMIVEEGLEKRIKRHRLCAKAFYSAIADFGFDFFADPPFRSSTVIAAKVPEGLDEKALREIMREKYGVVIAGSREEKLMGKIVRIGSMGIVSEKEVTATIDAMGKSLIELGYKVNLDKALNSVKEVFRA